MTEDQGVVQAAAEATAEGESDVSQILRMFAVAHLNEHGVPAEYDGPLWDTTTLQEDFTVEGFMAPFVVVRRKSDGARGTLTFIHSPRIYYDFTETSR